MITRLFTVVLCLLACSGVAIAESPKPYTFGPAIFVTDIYRGDQFDEDGTIGGGLSFTAKFHEVGTMQLAGRANWAPSMRPSDFSRIDIRMYELSLLLGQGLDMAGVHWYMGGGYFSERWQHPDPLVADATLSGLQFLLGVGWSWEVVTLDCWLGLRDASDYKTEDTSPLVSSLGLSLGFRF
jgi:hypothetical protein